MQGFYGWQAVIAKVGAAAMLIASSLPTSAFASDKSHPFVAAVQISEVLAVPSPDGNCSATAEYPGFTGQGTISGTGLGAPIGAFAIASVDCVRSSTAGNFVPPFGFSSKAVTLTVASGDQIVVSYSGAGDVSPLGLMVLKGTYTILSGTGSFQKVKGSGTLTGIEDILSIPARGFVTLTGQISY